MIWPNVSLGFGHAWVPKAEAEEMIDRLKERIADLEQTVDEYKKKVWMRGRE